MNLTERKYDGWTGVNCSDDPMTVDATEMVDCRNLLFTNFGEFMVRNGLYNKLVTVGDIILEIYDIYHDQIIYQTDDGKLYLLSEDEDVEDTLIATLNKLEPIAYAHCPADNKVYFASDSDALFSWDGAAITTVTSNVFGNVMFWYQNHLFIGNNARIGTGTVYNNRVYISPLGDPTAEWSADDWTPWTGKGDLVGLAELGDHVLVMFGTISNAFTTGYGLNSWQLTEDNDATTNVDNSVGCAGRNAFCRVGNELWFMDNQKNIRVIYQTDFDPYRKTYRSEKISEWIGEISNALFDETQMLYFDNKVWVFAPDITGVKSIVLVFDLLAAKKAKLKPDGTMGEAWTRFDGEKWNVSAAAVQYTAGGFAQLRIACGTNLFLYGGNTDDDEPIQSWCQTKNDDFGKYSVLKRYKLFFGKADILNDTDEVRVSVSIENSDETYIGSLRPSALGMILCEDEGDEPAGNATLNVTEQGIWDGDVYDDELGRYQPEATKLRYDAGSAYCTARTIQHFFRISSSGPVSVSKVSSNFQVRNVK